MGSYDSGRATELGGINLKQKREDSLNGIRFNDARNSHPSSASDVMLYRYGTSLYFWNGSSSILLGEEAGGAMTIPSLDAIIQNDQTMQLAALSTFTIDRSSGNNDILTITNTGGGSGQCLQITNVGTGKDIQGTSGLWSVSNVGDIVGNIITLAGDTGANSLTLTTGDVSVAAGSVTIIDKADNAATFSVTNNTATTASVFVFAASAAFTGSTTTSLMTITSGATTGTVLYVPVAGLTTGKAIHSVANALTSGSVVHISSSATGITSTTGGLIQLQHTGTTTTSGVLMGITSAANDETTLLKLSVSDVLALGVVLDISATAMTTGTGALITVDALSTGKGLSIASATTSLATTGRMLLVSHTGATTTSGVLSEFITSATDETTVVQISTAAMIDGTALNIVGTTGMTSGSLLRLASSTAGAVATNGVVSLKSTGAFTSAAGIGFVDIGASATTAGTLVHITASNASQATNILLHVVQSGVTTGYTGSVASFTGTSTTGDANVVLITSANTTDGRALKIVSGVTTTNGSAMLIQANALTTGVGLRFAHTTTVIADGGSMVRLSSSSVDTGGATTGQILDIANTGSVVGTLVKMYSNVASQTATTILDIAQAGATLTAFTDDVVSITGGFSGNSSTGSVLTVTGVNTTAGNTVKIDASAVTTGTGLLVTSAGVLITTGELVSFVANGATTCTGVLRASATALTDGYVAEFTGGGANFSATGGMVNLQMGAATVGSGLKIVTSGIYVGTTGLVNIDATQTTTGTIIDILNEGRTTGDVLKITTNTTGTGNYINCYDGAATDFKVSRYGAVTIAGNAAGTAALTLTAGDLIVSGGDVNFAVKVIFSGIETIAAGGTTTALDLAKTLHSVDADAGGDIFTLADGTIGQVMFISCKTATGVATVTPANLAGGTSVTLNAEGDCVILMFVDTQWYIMGGNGYSVI
jgi:fibronectin-binding autotransporter adhesin